MSERRSKFYRDPNEILTFNVKSFGCHEIIIAVCKERGLKCVLERPDEQADFMVFHIVTTASQFKAARCEWCRRMSVDSSYTGKWQAPPLYSPANGYLKSIDLFE